MLLERTLHPGWLSNSYLVADRPGGHAVIIDTGGPSAPHLAKIDELGLTLTHVLCTHHHIDHVTENAVYRARYGCPVCGGTEERDRFEALDVELHHGDTIYSGGLRIETLHIPGHTLGQKAFLVNGNQLFTGDTLFRGSVGGTRAPGHGTLEQLRHSILNVLLRLPPATVVRPGHTEPTTVGDEWDRNPFVRMWRGLDTGVDEPCVALGQPARLLLRASDYDGGTKCWVRFTQTDEEAIVPGSRVAAA
jgi:hydroxyacylglutathione hydrolase